MIKTRWYQIVAILSLFALFLAVFGAPGLRAKAQTVISPDELLGIDSVEMRSETRCEWDHGREEVGDVMQDVWRFERRRAGPGPARHDTWIVFSDSVAPRQAASAGGLSIRGEEIVIRRLSMAAYSTSVVPFTETVLRRAGEFLEGQTVAQPPHRFPSLVCPDGIRRHVRLHRL